MGIPTRIRRDQRRHLAGYLGLLIALMLAGAVALAGPQPPPSDGDDFVFKEGGLRYSGDGRLADAGGIEAGCGTKRWRLIGGGGGVSGTADAKVWMLRPVDFDSDGAGDDGWFAAGDGAPGAVATSFAICARRERLRYRIKHVPDSLADLRSAKVGCGSPRFHVTTGGVVVGTTDSFVSSSYPSDGKDRDRRPDDGWAGNVHDLGLGGFTMYAVCVRGAKVDYRRGKAATIPTSSAVARKVGCSKRGHAVGGGGRVTGPINRGRITSTHPYDGQDGDQAPDDGWRTSAYNLSSGTASKLIPYAICLR